MPRCLPDRPIGVRLLPDGARHRRALVVGERNRRGQGCGQADTEPQPDAEFSAIARVPQHQPQRRRGRHGGEEGSNDEESVPLETLRAETAPQRQQECGARQGRNQGQPTGVGCRVAPLGQATRGTGHHQPERQPQECDGDDGRLVLTDRPPPGARRSNSRRRALRTPAEPKGGGSRPWPSPPRPPRFASGVTHSRSPASAMATTANSTPSRTSTPESGATTPNSNNPPATPPMAVRRRPWPASKKSQNSISTVATPQKTATLACTWRLRPTAVPARAAHAIVLRPRPDSAATKAINEIPPSTSAGFSAPGLYTLATGGQRTGDSRLEQPFAARHPPVERPDEERAGARSHARVPGARRLAHHTDTATSAHDTTMPTMFQDQSTWCRRSCGLAEQAVVLAGVDRVAGGRERLGVRRPPVLHVARDRQDRVLVGRVVVLDAERQGVARRRAAYGRTPQHQESRPETDDCARHGADEPRRTVRQRERPSTVRRDIRRKLPDITTATSERELR